MLAIEATEPTLPMERTDPREPIDNTESVDHKDRCDELVGFMHTSSGAGVLGTIRVGERSWLDGMT